MTTLEDIAEMVEAIYHENLSTYEHSEHVVVTNGSAAFDVKLIPSDETIQIRGHKDDRKLNEECDATVSALEAELSTII